MDNRDTQILKKILNEIEIAKTLLFEINIEDFLENEMLKRASCMTVINIGELVKHLSSDIRLKYKNIPWKAIAGFRDIAAHKYQTLRMEDVFETITNDFNELQNNINSIINEI